MVRTSFPNPLLVLNSGVLILRRESTLCRLHPDHHHRAQIHLQFIHHQFIPSDPTLKPAGKQLHLRSRLELLLPLAQAAGVYALFVPN